MLTIFVAQDFSWDFTTRSDNPLEQAGIRIRAYKSLEGLQPIQKIDHESGFIPFESRWMDPVSDLPTHDLLPIDFDFERLGLGEYYDQKDYRSLQATKIGGWPYTVQSEPWWDYRKDENDFVYCLQIECEPKANWYFGDGAIYIARSRKDPDLWAINVQMT